jgi:hypothetical protein
MSSYVSEMRAILSHEAIQINVEVVEDRHITQRFSTVADVSNDLTFQEVVHRATRQHFEKLDLVWNEENRPEKVIAYQLDIRILCLLMKPLQLQQGKTLCNPLEYFCTKCDLF